MSMDKGIVLHPMHCTLCMKWLNGEAQFVDHKMGKTHRRNFRWMTNKLH